MKLSEFRIISGLSWKQIAQLCDVPLQTLLFWVSGAPIPPNSKLEELVEVIQYIDRGSANQNRRLILSSYEQLLLGEYTQVKESIGPGTPRQRPPRIPLSREEWELRKPLPPEILIDALQDPIHQEIGNYRYITRNN